MTSKRPWKLKMRYLTSRGTWTQWRVHGTYTTNIRAIAGAEKERARWAKVNIPCETFVVPPGNEVTP